MFLHYSVQLLPAVGAARVGVHLGRRLLLPGQHGVQAQDGIDLGRRRQGQGLPVHGGVPAHSGYVKCRGIVR